MKSSSLAAMRRVGRRWQSTLRRERAASWGWGMLLQHGVGAEMETGRCEEQDSGVDLTVDNTVSAVDAITPPQQQQQQQQERCPAPAAPASAASPLSTAVPPTGTLTTSASTTTQHHQQAAADPPRAPTASPPAATITPTLSAAQQQQRVPTPRAHGSAVSAACAAARPRAGPERQHAAVEDDDIVETVASEWATASRRVTSAAGPSQRLADVARSATAPAQLPQPASLPPLLRFSDASGARKQPQRLQPQQPYPSSKSSCRPSCKQQQQQQRRQDNDLVAGVA